MVGVGTKLEPFREKGNSRKAGSARDLHACLNSRAAGLRRQQLLSAGLGVVLTFRHGSLFRAIC